MNYKNYLALIIGFAAVGMLLYSFSGKKNTLPVNTVGVTSPEPVVESGDCEFTDGLTNPTSLQKFQLDEFGAGIAEIAIFTPDINNDGKPDKITRTQVENGTAHFYFDYKVELNNSNGYTDITPDDFRTVEGADCSLQKLHFAFRPNFAVTKISRPWQDTWITPTVASKTIYRLKNQALVPGKVRELSSVCDVTDLFNKCKLRAE